MKIELWEGGLQAQEVKAIKAIKKAFSPSSVSEKKVVRGGSLKDQLRSISVDPMHTWKGYAGFRFVDKQGKEGEFDLLIITHCNILIVELKDWNNGEVTSHGDKWYKNDREMGRSPVSVTRNKKFLIENKLKLFRNKFTNKGYIPQVHYLIVMTGNAGFQAITELELLHTVSLNEFLALSDEHKFNARFRPHPNSKTLQQDISIFDRLLIGSNTKPKHFTVNGFMAKDHIFTHPKDIYREYHAVSELSKNDEALLRVWDFNKLEGVKAQTPEGRLSIVSREREVLQFIKHQNLDLYNHCLRSLTSLQKDDITTEYCEIYELPPEHVRFNKFIGKYCSSFSEIDRLNLVKLLVAKFADLHIAKIAHRDLGDHSIWISPSKEVALSSFISAYHQPIGTVGDYRSALSVNNELAPIGMLVTDKTTPFQMDVYSLGLLAWHILKGKRLSPESVKTLRAEIENSEEWYSSVIVQAIDGSSFSYAGDFFESIKNNEPSTEKNYDFDFSEFEPFQQPISHSRQYREDGDLIKETGSKEVYVSNQKLVKAWLKVDPINGKVERGYKVLHFLQRISKLQSISPPYIPCIRDFGLASKSSSLYLVTDFVEGVLWGKLDVNIDEKFVLIHQLITAVEHLHGLGIAHGDLHPENVIVSNSEGEPQLYLIDIPDISLDTDEQLNHRYSPENIDGCTAFERDIFAVVRMTCELLDISWGCDSELYSTVTNAVKVELEDTLFGFKDLARFKEAIDNPHSESDTAIETIDIVVRGDFDPLIIYPDNGRLYIQIEPSNKNTSEAKVKLMGIGGSVDLIYSPRDLSFTVGFEPRLRSSVSRRDIDRCQLELSFAINIVGDQYSKLDNLSNRLAGNDEFQRAVNLSLTNDKEPEVIEELLDNSELGLEILPVTTVKDEVKKVAISTAKLWRAILDTETESHPYIEVAGDVFKPKGQNDQLVIYYESETDVLDSFRKTDVIEVIQVNGEKEFRVGVVNLKASSLNEVRLVKPSPRANGLADGDVLFFRTKADKASYEKRKDALERLLNNEGVISELGEYFEPTCIKPQVTYDIEVSDDDFSRYDRQDVHGNKISLNLKQREAFTKLLQNGPLSLLQGPPGTGKTEFIAAFVHYLIEKEGANNILLVSQSHEAVNTAAERIRKHCSNLNTPLEVVRFSNREGAVSVGLKDVYSNALITERRELFKAEASYRVKALSQALGLEPEYLTKLIDLEMHLFKQIGYYGTAVNQLDDENLDDTDKVEIKKSIKELEQLIKYSLIQDYELSIESREDVLNAKQNVLKKLEFDFAIKPDEAKRANALAKISSEMLDVLGTERVNYDEFFARSRQLVTGTCVGIGQRHIGIAENQYDWVIIDEAARSIASELSIAMQSAKRVLLVGDHKQLPPLYSSPHKKALARKLGIAANENDLDELLCSDFARVFDSTYGEKTGAQLLTQYRMATPIGDLVSRCFYDGELKNGERPIPDIYSDAPKAIKSVVTWLDTSDFGKRANHLSDKGVSIYNRCEADQIINVLKEISNNYDFVQSLNSLVREEEAAIGVICMYAEQKKILHKKFKEEIWDERFKSLVKIDTVDSYQGKENRVVILSITRSNNDQSPGFLRSPNRINVALSRAMDRLLIVGDANMWRSRNNKLPLGKVLNFISDKNIINDYQVIPAQSNINRKGVSNE